MSPSLEGFFNIPPLGSGNNADDVTNLDFDASMNDPANAKLFGRTSVDKTIPTADTGNRYVDASMKFDDEMLGTLTADELMGFGPIGDFTAPPRGLPPMAPVPTSAITPNYLPTSPPVPQNTMPNMAMGPSWNPMIGWYYPVMPATPMGMAPPQMPFRMAQVMPQRAFRSMTSVSQTPITSHAARPKEFSKAEKPTGRKKKAKYGPAAFLEQKAKEAARAARSLSVEDFEYTSAAKVRADRAVAMLNPIKRIGAPHRRNQPSIVQACICAPEKELNKVKRPKNAFILYRSANSDRIFKQISEKTNQNVSKAAAQMWKNESQEVKDRFYQMAADEAIKHKLLYPGYKYQPGLMQKHRFGSESCTCGAYQLNLAANSINVVDKVADETDADDAFTPTGAQLTQPPPCPIVDFDFGTPGPSIFGFMPAPQTRAQTFIDNCKRKRAAATITVNDDNAPISKRLRSSSRSPPKNISYADPTFGDLWTDNPFTMDQTPQKTRRPSPINPFSNPTNTAAVLATTFPPATFALDDSPSRNTRSKSRASAELEQQLQQATDQQAVHLDTKFIFDDDDIDWGLFNGELGDDNIVVASRRSSEESRKGRGSPKSGAR